MLIFEKWWFSTYMDNMHIKWKLKSSWIHIWSQKVLLCMKFFEKIWFQNFFLQFSNEKKILIANFSKFFFDNPQIFFLRMILNTKNENYMKVWQSWPHPTGHGRPSKSRWADSTPPPFLGLNIYLIIPYELCKNAISFMKSLVCKKCKIKNPSKWAKC